jgi:hypothetical protein
MGHNQRAEIRQGIMRSIMTIFEVLSKQGVNARLTKTQWDHIALRHKELENQRDKIKETLQEPNFILYSTTDHNYQYYRYYSKTPFTAKYLLVNVKKSNSHGFIITAFFVGKIKEKGKVKIYG